MVILRIEVLVHLTPEHLTGSCVVGIVETILIARTYPVVDIIGGTLDIHPALRVEFLVVVRVAIELWPDRDHEAPMHGVNGIKHRLRIRES